jgi:hypothetical protein
MQAVAEMDSLFTMEIANLVTQINKRTLKTHITVREFGGILDNRLSAIEARIDERSILIDKNIEELKTTNTIAQPYNQVLEKMMKKTDKEVLDWLSPVDHTEMHLSKRRERLIGTGEWFLASEPFSSWAGGMGPNFLFCYGKGTSRSPAVAKPG